LSVIAIMPHAPASGKARAGRGSHAAALEHFPASGMGQSAGTEICYDVDMAKQRKPVAKGAKGRGLTIARARFAKISAVEGIHLTQAMEERHSEAGRKGLTPEEKRRTIERSYRKG
jgi:hypothetical protein